MKAVMIVHANPTDASREAEFNQWYEENHIPDMVKAVDGVVSGRRYRYSDVQRVPAEAAPAHRYITIYELDSDDLSSVVEQMKTAQVHISDSMDLAVSPPVLYFYDEVSPAGD